MCMCFSNAFFDVQLCPPIKFPIQSTQLMSRGRKRILGGGQGLWKQKEEKSCHGEVEEIRL